MNTAILVGVGICALVVLSNILSRVAKHRRSVRLLAKYGDAEVVEKIMKRTVWDGMTEDQLVDSIGKPVESDLKHLKTKRVETWKYQQTGKNRFDLRVTIENGLVVGVQKKG